ncbi:MAG: topoisomerase DNA-binding C4 zinc finger domain-containing protein [Bacilli bacterium]
MTKCILCKTGIMVLRKGPFGKFWGCSNYPKCRWIIKKQPKRKFGGKGKFDAFTKRHADIRGRNDYH